MCVGRSALALSSGVRWRSGAVGVENLYFNSIKLKSLNDTTATTTSSSVTTSTTTTEQHCIITIPGVSKEALGPARRYQYETKQHKAHVLILVLCGPLVPYLWKGGATRYEYHRHLMK